MAKTWLMPLLVSATLFGCGQSEKPPAEPLPQAHVTGAMALVATSDRAAARPGETINVLAKATLPTSDGAVPASGIVVNFVVVEGAGKVFAGSATTNQSGEAREVWTLGPQVGRHVLEVRSVDQITGRPLVHARIDVTVEPAKAEVKRQPFTVGDLYNCGITADNVAYCWGDNFYGQTGSGLPFQSAHVVATPTPVESGGVRFAAISAGNGHTCALSLEGEAYCWGNGEAGQLGIGKAVRNAPPTAVSGGLRFNSISAGGSLTCAVGSDRRAYCWGAGTTGAIGDGAALARMEPTLVAGLSDIAEVYAGGGFACALTSGGAAYCWGDDGYGQLGSWAPGYSSTPLAVPGGPFVQLGTGQMKACALSSTGAASCWGDGNMPPTAVEGNHTFAQVAGGGGHPHHSCGISSAGATYCWGRNDLGQLGNGTHEDSTAPVLVSGSLAFVHVDPRGYNHACALTAEGAAYCWGDNHLGQWGGSELTGSSVPVEVSNTLRFR